MLSFLVAALAAPATITVPAPGAPATNRSTPNTYASCHGFTSGNNCPELCLAPRKLARASFHSDLPIGTPGMNEHALGQIVAHNVDLATGVVTEQSEIFHSQEAT